MNFLPELRLRSSVALLLVVTTLVTLAIVGSGILAVMIPRITEENQMQVNRAAAEMAGRVEVYLEDIEDRVTLAAELYRELPAARLPEMLEVARGDTFEAVYIIAANGKLVASGISDSSAARRRELVDIDLSTYPLFVAAMENGSAAWSEKHLSAVTGKVNVGLAVPIGGKAGVAIAELPLDRLLEISRIAKGDVGLEHWVIDRKGEVVADTSAGLAQRVNLFHLPIVAAGFTGEPLPEVMSFRGNRYQVSASRSEALGWLFVSRIPAGLENAHVRETVTIVLAAFIGSVLVGLLLAPLWAQGIVRPLRAVADGAHKLANGNRPAAWPRGKITEFNQLSKDLGTMADAIMEREQELRSLNEELEERVSKRTTDLTRTNLELSDALSTLEYAKDELIQSEKLAALGRLVAGVAHELNTPLGNGRMAVTALLGKLTRFENNLADGLRRSELDSFIDGVRTSSDIAERNMVRASELIASFKQVAADRTASRRRKFLLSEVVKEVVLTLSPSMKRRPTELLVDVPGDLHFDSYPGDLGQVLTNLIENCVSHAFEGLERGTIEISATLIDPERVSITLRDDGIGMSPAVVHRVFDPFFTTNLGRGGTGLGLFITHNSVTNVLGGTISVESTLGEGSCFELRLPLIAPLEEATEQPAEGSAAARSSI